LNKAQAQWITRDTIAWKIAPGTAEPSRSTTARQDRSCSEGRGQRRTDILLTYDPAGCRIRLLTNYPQLTGYSTFKLSERDVAEALKSQLAVSAKDARGRAARGYVAAIPGALDDLYTYNGPLGATFSGLAPTFRLWAPTARSVKLRLYNDSNPSRAGP